jgi:NitT/TauT family transport system substrate-binding protein
MQVNVEFKWFDYSASLSAFSANQLDAVFVTNGDDLLTASGGTQGMIWLRIIRRVMM